MGALLMDLAVFAYMAFLAISERGTFMGWLGTLAVIAYTIYTAFIFYRKT